MKIIQSIVSISFLSIASMCAHADTLAGNGSFQTWNSSVLSSPGGPYWNNASGDGSQYNVGWCVAGTGNCHIANPPGTAASYYGNGTAAASNMSLSGSGLAQVATLAGLFSNQNGVPPSGVDVFGWYSASGSTITTHVLFNSSVNGVGATALFTPTASYGFFLENIQSGGQSFEADRFYFTNDSLNYAAGTGVADALATQHFTAFSAASGTYFGVEDTPAATSDFDFNDMIIQVQQTPEPASIALMASGLGVLGWSMRRRRA